MVRRFLELVGYEPSHDVTYVANTVASSMTSQSMVMPSPGAGRRLH